MNGFFPNWSVPTRQTDFECFRPAAIGGRVRIALFGSFMGGYHVLKELLFGSLAHRVEVLGVATDDPTQSFSNSRVRLWKYPHKRSDETLVRDFARDHDLPVYDGRIKTAQFYSMYFLEWRPQLCLMATFGQKIPGILIDFPKLGFFNFHHSGETWPSYPGPDPIAGMVRDGKKHLVLTIHKVTDVIDGGEFVARSHRIPIPDGINAIDMHRITWPQMGPFICQQVGEMLQAAEMTQDIESQTFNETVRPYNISRGTAKLECLAA